MYAEVEVLLYTLHTFTWGGGAPGLSHDVLLHTCLHIMLAVYSKAVTFACRHVQCSANHDSASGLLLLYRTCSPLPGCAYHVSIPPFLYTNHNSLLVLHPAVVLLTADRSAGLLTGIKTSSSILSKLTIRRCQASVRGCWQPINWCMYSKAWCGPYHRHPV
jgi:hypothetical protein